MKNLEFKLEKVGQENCNGKKVLEQRRKQWYKNLHKKTRLQ